MPVYQVFSTLTRYPKPVANRAVSKAVFLELVGFFAAFARPLNSPFLLAPDFWIIRPADFEVFHGADYATCARDLQ